MGYRVPNVTGNDTVDFQSLVYNQKKGMVRFGRLLCHRSKCKLQVLSFEGTLADRAQVFLTLLASCIYGATIFGFGKRVVDIKASGGNITKAMRVSQIDSLS